MQEINIAGESTSSDELCEIEIWVNRKSLDLNYTEKQQSFFQTKNEWNKGSTAKPVSKFQQRLGNLLSKSKSKQTDKDKISPKKATHKIKSIPESFVSTRKRDLKLVAKLLEGYRAVNGGIISSKDIKYIISFMSKTKTQEERFIVWQMINFTLDFEILQEMAATNILEIWGSWFEMSTDHYEVRHVVAHSLLKLVELSQYREVLKSIMAKVNEERDIGGTRNWIGLLKRIKIIIQRRLELIEQMHIIDSSECQKFVYKPSEIIINEAILFMHRQANPKLSYESPAIKTNNNIEAKWWNKKKVR